MTSFGQLDHVVHHIKQSTSSISAKLQSLHVQERATRVVRVVRAGLQPCLSSSHQTMSLRRPPSVVTALAALQVNDPSLNLCPRCIQQHSVRSIYGCSSNCRIWRSCFGSLAGTTCILVVTEKIETRSRLREPTTICYQMCSVLDWRRGYGERQLLGTSRLLHAQLLNLLYHETRMRLERANDLTSPYAIRGHNPLNKGILVKRVLYNHTESYMSRIRAWNNAIR